MNENRTPTPVGSFAFCIFIGACSLIMGIFCRISGGEESQPAMIAFLALGILFVALGVGAIAIIRHVAKDTEADIIADGHYVMCDVDHVLYATGIDNREPVNSTHGIFHTPDEEDYDENEEVLHPYIIYCHYTNKKGKRRDYVVPNLWVNPDAYLKAHGNQIRCYIRNNDLNRYAFDLSVFEDEASV